MICPHIVNVSMMLGAILTWGFLWPYIDGKSGDWFPAGLREHDFKGLFGYKVTSPAIEYVCIPSEGYVKMLQGVCLTKADGHDVLSQL